MAEGMESSSGASRVHDDVELAMSERPTCILCLGMAGSGKTTFVQVEISMHQCSPCSLTRGYFVQHAETECSPAYKEDSTLYH